MAALKKKARKAVGVPILERAVALLEFLGQCPSGVALSEMARALKIPKNTIYRMLNTLCAHGYVERKEAELTYRLTRKLATLVYTSAQDKGLLESALGPMRELRDRGKETVVISILDGREGIVLEQVPGLHPFRFVCDPGTRQALHASASTKAILAFLGADRQAEILDGLTYPALTEHTITSRRAFCAELAVTRERGYGVDRAEALHGVHCVAAPVLDRLRQPVAAVTVTGPEERLREGDFKKVGEWALACARAISQQLV